MHHNLIIGKENRTNEQGGFYFLLHNPHHCVQLLGFLGDDVGEKCSVLMKNPGEK